MKTKSNTKQTQGGRGGGQRDRRRCRSGREFPFPRAGGGDPSLNTLRNLVIYSSVFCLFFPWGSRSGVGVLTFGGECPVVTGVELFHCCWQWRASVGEDGGAVGLR